MLWHIQFVFSRQPITFRRRHIVTIITLVNNELQGFWAGRRYGRLPVRHMGEAPLCPVECHEKAQRSAICNSKTFARPSWVKTQKKIRKLFSKGLMTDAECFTIPMLCDIKRWAKDFMG